MLEIDNLHAGYGRIPVLSGINFTVGEHEVVGVLGHNGMGKTTLLKTLIGQVPLTGGTMRFAGTDIGTMPSFRRARAGMGYVPQGRQIFPNLSVYENLRMGFVENGINSEENTHQGRPGAFPAARFAHRSASVAHCPAASSRSWRWHGACAAGPSSCCSTSRPKESSLRSSKKFSTS